MKIKSTVKGFLAAAVLFGATSAVHATIVYNIDRTIGDGSVTGFFETDETLGALSAGNILDWSLTVTAPNINGGASSTSSLGNGGQLFFSTGLSATATDLLYDFSGNDIFYTYTDTGDFWCVAGNGNGGCFDDNAEVIGYSDNDFTAAQTVFYSGTQSIASTGAMSVAEPGTLALLGLGLAGIGFARRKTA